MSGGGSKRGGGGRGGSGSKRGSTARAKSSRIARRNSQNGSGKRNSSNNNSSKDPIVTTKLVKSYRKIQPDQDYGSTERNEVGSKTVIRDYKKVSHLELAADVDDRLSADNVSLNYSTMEYVPDLSEHYGGSSSDDDDDENKGGEEENDDSDSSISVVSMAQYVSPFSADRAARNQPPLPGEDLVVDQGQPIKTPLGYNVVARAAYKPPLPEAASYFPPPLPDDTAFKPTESAAAETIDVKEPPPLTKSSFARKIGSHAYGRLGMQQAAPVLLIHMGRPGKAKKKWLRTYKVARKKTGEKYPLRLDDFDLGPAVPEGKYFEGLTWPNPRPPPEAENRHADILFVEMMSWCDLQPDVFQFQYHDEGTRLQFVRARGGRFSCQSPGCYHRWTSHYTWVCFDLYLQSVQLFRQRCPECSRKCKMPGASTHTQHVDFIQPEPFKYSTWKKCCLQAIYKALQSLNRSRAIGFQLEGMNLIGEAPEPKLVQDALTNEERLFLNTHCTIDHDPELCEYCQFRGGPCWNPHRPSDCPKCIGSDLGCCFNADLFLDQTVVVVPVDRTPKEKLKPYVFSSGPRVVETQISIRAL